MNYEIVEGLTDNEILEMYEDVVSVAGTLHFIECDNGLTGYFCLRAYETGRPDGEMRYYCEDSGWYDCYRNGSVGCFCGEGYRCAQWRYVEGNCK